MNVYIKNTKLPKLFYELKIHYFSEENLNEFNFVPNDLVYSTLQDLARFFYVVKHKVSETAIVFTDISGVNDFKSILVKSKMIYCIEINEVTEQLICGSYPIQEFWNELKNKEDELTGLKKDEVIFFLEYLKTHSSVEDVVNKISNRGYQNLLQPELEILESNE